MNVLVVGADRVDAGKTTFSTGLLDRIGGVGFKPRAGNDYWFDHDDCRRALSDGRLFGTDARRLAAASATSPRPETINPVHRLWRPVRGSADGLVGREDRSFVVDRVGDEFVVNGVATAPDRVRAALPLADAPAVESVDELNALTRERYFPAFEALAETIRATDRAVVESYGDVATPLPNAPADAVAVVEPGRARVYRGDRWLTACEVAAGSAGTDPGLGRLEQRVSDVEVHVTPVAAVDLPPLLAGDRADPSAVNDAYEVAYDAVIDAVDA
jgi:predicted P-loop ATPase/GTPase